MRFTALSDYCTRVWKDELPFLREADKFTMNNSLLHLGAGFQRFVQKQGRHPKYKSRKDRGQLCSTNVTNGNIELAFLNCRHPHLRNSKDSPYGGLRGDGPDIEEDHHVFWETRQFRDHVVVNIGDVPLKEPRSSGPDHPGRACFFFL